VALGIDLQMAGDGETIYLKTQHDPSGGWLLSVQPQVLRLAGSYVSAAGIRDHLLGLHPLSPARCAAADLNANGTVDIGDLVRRINLGD
jgi:hypothetical protein